MLRYFHWQMSSARLHGDSYVLTDTEDAECSCRLSCCAETVRHLATYVDAFALEST